MSFSITIQRPGHAAHLVQELPDSRKGGTYLKCDCAGWAFAIKKGGCVHVKEAERLREAGVRTIESTAEQRATLEEVARRVSGLPVSPMLALAAGAPIGDNYPPDMLRDDYCFEVKWDGYRMIAVNDGKRTTLYSRPGRVITNDWPEIAAAIPSGVVLDGEVIMVKDGKSSFQALQNAKRMRPEARAEGLRYVAFDILKANSHLGVDGDLSQLPLIDRRNILADHLEDNPIVTFSHAIPDGRDAWRQVLEHGLEGLIAKPLRSRYVQGNRGIWLKHKRNVVQVFEIIGFTSGEGTRYGLFGALVLGERVNGKLRYAGKCGTGFDHKATVQTLEAMQEHVVKTPPVDPGQAVVIRQHLGARAITWLKPTLKAKVEFNDWSDDRIVRMGSFKGLQP